MAKILVETIATIRFRYVVETPDDHPEYALDTVTCEDATEVSQEFLGELIVSHRKISKKEYLKMFDQDNAYLAAWDEEKKMEYITRMPK